MDSNREGRISFSDLQFSSDDLLVDYKVVSDDETDQSPISLSSSSPNQDFVGFFSEEWSNTSTTAPISSNTSEGIVLFGKVIDTSRKTQIETKSKKTNKSYLRLARWNSDSCRKCSNHDSSLWSAQSKSLPILGRKKEPYNKNDVLVKRISKLAFLVKLRWPVFVYESGRFPMKMGLSDLRSRQLRRSHRGEEEKSGGKRLSGLITVLGCGGGFNDDEMMMTEAS